MSLEYQLFMIFFIQRDQNEGHSGVTKSQEVALTLAQLGSLVWP